eukprot:3580773-Pleurochrysis_carterae.AAC.1
MRASCSVVPFRMASNVSREKTETSIPHLRRAFLWLRTQAWLRTGGKRQALRHSRLHKMGVVLHFARTLASAAQCR